MTYRKTTDGEVVEQVLSQQCQDAPTQCPRCPAEIWVDVAHRCLKCECECHGVRAIPNFRELRQRFLERARACDEVGEDGLTRAERAEAIARWRARSGPMDAATVARVPGTQP
jgi:hypothetical protein